MKLTILDNASTLAGLLDSLNEKEHIIDYETFRALEILQAELHYTMERLSEEFEAKL